MSGSDTDTRSDNELVALCNEGARHVAVDAFAALYARHRGYVLRIAMRFTRDRELALDVLQETFTYVLGRFPPPGPGLTLTARFTTYLYPIAKNYSITALRKTERAQASDQMPEELADEAARVHGEDNLDLALAKLSPERREVLTLRFVDGMSLDEVAAALDIALGTVKSRLHLAIKQLRDDPQINDLFEP